MVCLPFAISQGRSTQTSEAWRMDFMFEQQPGCRSILSNSLSFFYFCIQTAPRDLLKNISENIRAEYRISGILNSVLRRGSGIGSSYKMYAS